MSPEIELLAILFIFGGALWYSIRFIKNGILDIVEGYKIKNKVIVVKGVWKIIVIPLGAVGVWVLWLSFIKMCYFCH